MRALAFIAAIAVAGCGFQAAEAADVRQLDCPTASLTEPERAAFQAGVDAQAERTDTRFDSFRSKLEECARTHGWSEELTRFARLYNLGAAGQSGARRQIQALGVDLAPIERALLADTALIAAAGAGTFPEAQMMAFLNSLHPSMDELVAAHPEAPELAERIGNFIAFRAVMESARASFVAN